MDTKKIGKLIATLRKKQELTQQELGDKVGVGFRAVSKWERGINLPDISIINDLSKILGISSDELLSGELKPETQSKDNKDTKKLSLTIKITLSSILIAITLFISIFVSLNNKTHIYELVRANGDDYYIEGKVTFQGNKFTIIISELGFTDLEFKSTIIKNYDYKVISKDKLLFGYGYDPNDSNLVEKTSIETFLEEFRINYTGEIEVGKKEITDNNLYLIINFIDQNDKLITKKIDIILQKK